jgi:hypothetical protein
MYGRFTNEVLLSKELTRGAATKSPWRPNLVFPVANGTSQGIKGPADYAKACFQQCVDPEIPIEETVSAMASF